MLETTLINAGVAAITFIFFWKVIGQRFFKPYFSALEKREKKTQEAAERVVENQLVIESLQAEYNDQIADARLEGIKMRDEAIAQGNKKYQETLSAALEEASKAVDEARAKIGADKQRVIEELEKEVDSLVEEVVNKTLETPKKSDDVTVH